MWFVRDLKPAACIVVSSTGFLYAYTSVTVLYMHECIHIYPIYICIYSLHFCIRTSHKCAYMYIYSNVGRQIVSITASRHTCVRHTHDESCHVRSVMHHTTACTFYIKSTHVCVRVCVRVRVCVHACVCWLTRAIALCDVAHAWVMSHGAQMLTFEDVHDRHAATHCNALQHTATNCNTLQQSEKMWCMRSTYP